MCFVTNIIFTYINWPNVDIILTVLVRVISKG